MTSSSEHVASVSFRPYLNQYHPRHNALLEKPLQMIQNVAVYLVFKQPKGGHVTWLVSCSLVIELYSLSLLKE